MVEETKIGFARRVKFHEARRHFLFGGTVLVTERDRGPTISVTNLTTTHAGNAAAWQALVDQVREWRGRYPRQRFYVVGPTVGDSVTWTEYPGVAFYVHSVETEPDADTEWTGIEHETGNLIVVMVGDDRKHSADPDDLSPLDDDDYCHECGQVGCTHDGRTRDDD